MKKENYVFFIMNKLFYLIIKFYKFNLLLYLLIINYTLSNLNTHFNKRLPKSSYYESYISSEFKSSEFKSSEFKSSELLKFVFNNFL